MNFQISIGQYYPVESPIHALDPRIKILATFNLIILLFVAADFWAYGVIGAAIATVIALSRVPVKFILRGLRALIYIIIFTVAINMLFAPGEQLLFSLGRFNVTVESLTWGLQMGSRLIMLIISSSVLTLTTSPVELTGAIESLLSPFKKLIPAHEIAMMMTIALRFIPTLLEEADKITKAQIARGAAFDTGTLTQRVKCLIPILVPLFVSAFRRADDLAIAMEARCYRGDINRTKMKELRYSNKDYKAMILIIILTVFIISTRLW